MAKVQIDVSGLDALRSSMEGVRERIETELASAVEAEAEAVAADARSSVRVRTGDLQQSITAEVEGTSATVAPRSGLLDGPYEKAMVNEFGRSNDPGQPYMVPAAEASRQRWPQRASEAVKRATRG